MMEGLLPPEEADADADKAMEKALNGGMRDLEASLISSGLPPSCNSGACL